MKTWSLIFAALLPVPSAAEGDDLRERAERSLRRAVDFFRKEVAHQGGYLWRYSEDLSRREGEGKATATMVWVQPPGTPTIGMAYLEAHQATGDGYYLEAARETGRCLVRGQLRSGGWTRLIDFDPRERRRYAYRVEGGGDEKARNVSSLDDDMTQSALRLLMRLDRALDGKDEEVHEAVLHGLKSLIAAQYPSGGWPQGFEGPAAPGEHPARKASYPETWSRTPPERHQYWRLPTLNDNAHATTLDTLLEAARLYGDAAYREAAKRAGDFLLLAQMPDPQPAWAQQYDGEMRPAWARKFEPPAISGGESQDVLRILLKLHEVSGDERYLEPIPRAIAYLKSSRLPGGRLARFYELGTNRPLYFTKDYRLTHDDSDVPTHYSFKVDDELDEIAREYDRARKEVEKSGPRAAPAPRPPGPALTERARAAVEALDERGRWLTKGRLSQDKSGAPEGRIIECRTFARNVQTLCDYLAAMRR